MEDNKIDDNFRTYAGIEPCFGEYSRAKIVLLPVPYDGTSTWQKGADKGPEAFLSASENMELYDIETASEPYRNGVFLAEAVTEDRSPEEMVNAVYERTNNYIKDGKFVTIFGGEHSISIGTIKAFNENFENLTVVQLDAHADLRENYHDSECNHACAVYKAGKETNLIQIGIRSMDIEELKEMNVDNVFFAHKIYKSSSWQEEAIGKMTENVFITIDLDVFDPSIMPSTGTPEPGGLLWYETIEFLRKIFEQRNVVGFDIMELCPREEEKSSDFLAAKLYYKLLAYKFNI